MAMILKAAQRPCPQRTTSGLELLLMAQVVQVLSPVFDFLRIRTNISFSKKFVSMTWKLLAMTLSKSLKSRSYLESWMEGRVFDLASGFNLDLDFKEIAYWSTKCICIGK